MARKFKQIAGDYHEIFSLITRFDSIRIILSVAVSKNMYLQQFDVKIAFLYGEIHETIYMQQPKGYENETKQVCKLNRILYGLKHASRCWNHCFTTVLSKFGLHPTNADQCVFTDRDVNNQLILIIHIDDGML